jgi:hypothetical protein
MFIGHEIWGLEVRKPPEWNIGNAPLLSSRTARLACGSPVRKVPENPRTAAPAARNGKLFFSRTPYPQFYTSLNGKAIFKGKSPEISGGGKNGYKIFFTGVFHFSPCLLV